jgi:hypothetical protein
MAKGLFLTLDGEVVVEYGKRRGAVSRARYKANGYQPVYEKLQQESSQSPTGGRKIQRANSVPAQTSYSQCQNWLRNDSLNRVTEA